MSGHPAPWGQVVADGGFPAPHFQYAIDGRFQHVFPNEEDQPGTAVKITAIKYHFWVRCEAFEFHALQISGEINRQQQASRSPAIPQEPRHLLGLPLG